MSKGEEWARIAYEAFMQLADGRPHIKAVYGVSWDELQAGAQNAWRHAATSVLAAEFQNRVREEAQLQEKGLLAECPHCGVLVDAYRAGK